MKNPKKNTSMIIKRTALVALSFGLLLGGCATTGPHKITIAEIAQEGNAYMRLHTPQLSHAMECVYLDPQHPGIPCRAEEFQKRMAAVQIERQANDEHAALQAEWDAEDLAARQQRLEQQQAAQVDELERQVSDLQDSQRQSEMHLKGLENEYGLTP